MKQMKTIKFPNDAETYEIVDAKAREDIEDLKANGGSSSKETWTFVLKDGTTVVKQIPVISSTSNS